MRSEHQKRIDLFMHHAGQAMPALPCVPSAEVRLLRAALIIEEALETIDALGFCVETMINDFRQEMTKPILIAHDRGPNLEQIADGCADLSVVTIGTLSACGIDDIPLLAEVDESNLRKFGEGAYKREDGKWMKPPDWQPPDIACVLGTAP